VFPPEYITLVFPPIDTYLLVGLTNCICFLGDVGTNTVSLELFKLMLNSVLSCKGVSFSTIDLKKIYLDTPMPDPEYVCIKITPTSQRNSYRNTSLRILTAAVGSTSKFAKAVMSFPKPASWPTISSNLPFLLKATTKRNPPRVSGATNGVPSNFA
jgi:hypothetical protein